LLKIREFDLFGKMYIKSLVLLVILITASIFWSGFQSQRFNATEGSETSTHFSGADLTGANLKGVNLTGVILDGVIFCNTTMPDGTINNSSCKN
jgi:uncharacterized protein YjbI with pentapeptide repeats